MEKGLLNENTLQVNIYICSKRDILKSNRGTIQVAIASPPGPSSEPKLEGMQRVENYKHFIPTLTRFSCSVNTCASDVPTQAIHSRRGVCSLSR